MSATEIPNLVLLPGLDGTGMLFRPLLACLPAGLRFKVIAYPTDRCLSIDEHVQLVARRLPRENFVLLAESFGGLLALQLLARSVPQIKAVLFVAAFAQPPHPLLLRLAASMPGIGAAARLAPAFLLRHFCLGSDATAAELSLLRRALAAVSPNLIAHRLKLIATRGNIEYGRFDTPCSYLQPSQDRLVPATAASWFRQRFERCEVESTAGPHFVLQARPQHCAEWIERKLKEQRSVPVGV